MDNALLENLEIRRSESGDVDAIESLYPDAFPDEDLLPVVRDLIRDVANTTSLVAVVKSQVVGHAIFAKCAVGGCSLKVSLLGPVAVSTGQQRQGVGSAIIRAGLSGLEKQDVSLVCVLGDPAYYKRLGFVPESRVEPPYELPPEWDGAWQSQPLGNRTISISGKLSVPRPWQEPAYWAP